MADAWSHVVTNPQWRQTRWCSTRATLTSPTRVDGQEPSSGTRSLVGKFLKEHCPPRMVYRLRKQPTGQTFYVQVFDKNQPVVVDEVSGQLVLKTVALVEHFAVHPGDQANRFLPALGELLATCYATLCSTKTLLCLLEQTRTKEKAWKVLSVRRSASCRT